MRNLIDKENIKDIKMSDKMKKVHIDIRYAFDYIKMMQSR